MVSREKLFSRDPARGARDGNRPGTRFDKKKFTSRLWIPKKIANNSCSALSSRVFGDPNDGTINQHATFDGNPIDESKKLVHLKNNHQGKSTRDSNQRRHTRDRSISQEFFSKEWVLWFSWSTYQFNSSINTIQDWKAIANDLVGKTRQLLKDMPPIARSSAGNNAQEYLFGSCGGFLGESYFAAEGDDDVSKVEKAAALSWRGDPLQTFSDWTIIVATSEFDSRTYHVHKTILSVGPRSSRYFSRLFMEGCNRYNQSQSSTRIELDEQDADSFPLFLDFMYDTSPDADDDASLTLNVNDDFSTMNAVSLRHLARVFDCEGLMLAVNKFIQKDLSLKTGPVYLVQAHLYQDDRLIESAKRLCIENFSRIETRSMTRLPLELFKSIITSVIDRSKSSHISVEEEESLSCHLSEVVCQYFEKHPDRMTVRLLLELTNEDVMPKIASEPAIGFTALARELNPKDVKPDSEEWRGLIALCQRCARAVVGEYGWKDFNISSALDEYLNGPCANEGSSSKLDSLLFATSFAAALERAQTDYQSVDNGSSKSKKQMEKLKQENDDLQWQNQGMKEEVDRYKKVLKGTKEELLLLRQQVKDLKRSHRAGLDELQCGGRM